VYTTRGECPRCGAAVPVRRRTDGLDDAFTSTAASMRSALHALGLSPPSADRAAPVVSFVAQLLAAQRPVRAY